jgi:NTE family protein
MDAAVLDPETSPSPEIGEKKRRGDLAVVLAGGGARAAYQAGVLRGIVRAVPKVRFDIITGVSAGGINAIFLACRPGSTARAVEELYDLWSNLRLEHVFRVDSPSLMRNMVRWAARLTSGGSQVAPRVRGLVDTAPLREMLHVAYNSPGDDITGIEEKLAQGELKAIALTTLNYSTGQTVTSVQGRQIDTWQRPNRRSVNANLTVEHVMASAALPLVFPAIRIDDAWHGDGGVRLTAPLSPALHLGATRILAMSTRYQRTFEEADDKTTPGYPPPVQVIGHLLNAVFLDAFDEDTMRLQRLNTVLEKLPPEEREGLRPVELLVMRPSQDIGKLAGKHELHLPRSLRFLLRGLGTKETSSPDFLSMLMFEPDYLRQLIEIGEKDAEARMKQLRALVT